MTIKNILKYVIRPILIMFVASFVLDIPFEREQELDERIIRAIIIGLLFGIFLLIGDKYKSRKRKEK